MIVFLSLRAMTALLQGPGVAVRVGEAGIVATLGIQPHAPSADPRLERILFGQKLLGKRHASRDRVLDCIEGPVLDHMPLGAGVPTGTCRLRQVSHEPVHDIVQRDAEFSRECSFIA